MSYSFTISRSKLLLSFGFLLCAILLSPATASYNPQIKIKLAKFFPVGVQNIVVTSPEPFSVLDQAGTPIVQAPSGTTYNFTDDSGTKVCVTSSLTGEDSEESEAGASLAGLCFTVRSAPGSFITISSTINFTAPHRYRGDITIFAGLNVVNTLPLEDYLKGVLKPEIGASAPEEALKAQAVASRTYTLRNMGKMIQSGADMDDTTRTQAYAGYDGETPTIDEAVDDTAGEVLLYNGQLINALYCTDCGGQTAVGGSDEPYLVSVPDPECATEPPWVLDISAEEAATFLSLHPSGSLEDISITIAQTDQSGRAILVKLVQGGHQKLLSGIQFRRVIGYDKLKSTLFKISRNSDGSFHIVGQGWGHGLGLCQRGAVYLAQHNSEFSAILRHYYSGAQLIQLNENMLGPTVMPAVISSRQSVLIRTVP